MPFRATVAAQDLLQWGRDRLIAEMTAWLANRSMHAGRLQWGRDRLIAEIPPSWPIGRGARGLQWGRDRLIAEMRRLGWPLPTLLCCFNGAAID